MPLRKSNGLSTLGTLCSVSAPPKKNEHWRYLGLTKVTNWRAPQKTGLEKETGAHLLFAF